MKCPECESTLLTWDYTKEGQVQDGLHRLHEVRVILYLGCDECSATVTSLSLEEYLEQLNSGYEKKKMGPPCQPGVPCDPDVIHPHKEWIPKGTT